MSNKLYYLKSKPKTNESGPQPKTWYDLIQDISFENNKEDLNLKAFTNNSRILFWHPLIIQFIWYKILKNRILFLCWSFPHLNTDIKSKLKLIKLKLAIKFSSKIFVNDDITFNSLKSITSKKPIMINYYIDTKYFFYKDKLNINNSYILIPGDMDRDEEMVIKLINENKYHVKRITRNKNLIEYYSKLKNPKFELLIDMSYNDLRNLYHNCSLVLLPIRNVSHPAGQTSVLEAISTGCPIVLTGKLTGSIFKAFKTISYCKNQISDITGSIDYQIENYDKFLTKKYAEQLNMELNYTKIKNDFKNLFL